MPISPEEATSILEFHLRFDASRPSPLKKPGVFSPNNVIYDIERHFGCLHVSTYADSKASSLKLVFPDGTARRMTDEDIVDFVEKHYMGPGYKPNSP